MHSWLTSEGVAEASTQFDKEPAALPPFEACYDRYCQRLYRYFYHQLGNAADAEDLTATAFTRLLANYPRYAADGSPAAVLFTIARNLVIDYWRQHRRHLDVATQAGLLVDPQPPPEQEALRAEQGREVRRLVAELPHDQREALLLRFYGGLSVSETADLLGRSEGAVKMLVHRGLARLGRAWREEERP